MQKNSKEKQVKSISEHARKIWGDGLGELKDFYPKNFLPSQASKFTAGNLGGHCKPPN